MQHYDLRFKKTLNKNSSFSVNQKILVQIGLEPAFLLSFLIDHYFRQKKPVEEEYFYLSARTIRILTRMSRHKFLKAKKILIQKKLIDCTYAHVSRRCSYKLNFQEILKLAEDDRSLMDLAYDTHFCGKELTLLLTRIEDLKQLDRMPFSDLEYFGRYHGAFVSTGNKTKAELIKLIALKLSPHLLSYTS